MTPPLSDWRFGDESSRGADGTRRARGTYYVHQLGILILSPTSISILICLNEDRCPRGSDDFLLPIPISESCTSHIPPYRRNDTERICADYWLD